MTTANHPEAAQGNVEFRNYLYGILAVTWFLVLPMFFVWSLAPDRVRYPALYGIKYLIEPSHVHVDKQPADCNWGSAPIGDKNCRYEKRLWQVADSNGQVTDAYVRWEKVQE